MSRIQSLRPAAAKVRRGGLDAQTLQLQLKANEDPKEVRSFRSPLTRKSCPEVSLFQKGLTIVSKRV